MSVKEDQIDSAPNMCFQTFLWVVNILVFIACVHSWLRYFKSKAMKKILSTSDTLFMAAFGPSCCRKTELLFQIIMRNTFYPNFSSIYYFYQHEQPKFSTIERKVNLFY